MNTYLFKLNRTLLASLILVFICVFSVNAGQDNIRFETIDLDQGLSQQNVRAIHQDSEGFMWFGTQEGLNRFDGYQFKVYSNSLNDLNSISSSYIHSIDETSDGRLWIATGVGVSVFDKEQQKFTRYKISSANAATTSKKAQVVYVDSLDNIWAGTSHGLNLYNPVTDSFDSVSLPIVDSATATTVEIESITEDITNGVWIAVKGHGLFRFDTYSQTIERYVDALDSGVLNSISKLYIDEDQQLWIGTIGRGVYVLDLKQPKSTLSENQITKVAGLDSVKARAIYQDNTKTVWVGTDSGLYAYDHKLNFLDLLKYDINDSQSIADNTISSIFQDNGGVFWVGTIRGLSKWNTATANFDYYRYQANREKSLSNPNINAIFDAGNDKVWVGTKNGLNLVDIDTGFVEQIYADPENNNTPSDNLISSVSASNKSELWLGYRSKGLTHIDRKTGVHTHYQHDKNDPDSIGANAVVSIFTSKSDEIWVATYGGGLNHFNPETGKFRRYKHQADNEFSLSSNLVMTVFEDSRKMLWVGTYDGGLNLFNPALGTSKRIMNDENDMYSLGVNEVWSVHEDRNGNIWVGTGGAGLNFLSAENRQAGIYRFERINREQGLPSTVVFGILEDSRGLLWLSTNRGLSKFDPETRKILNYDSSHGLQGNEFNAGAYHKMPNGKFFFGGTNGVTAFFPEDIEPNKHVPPVVLTRFQRLNEVTNMSSSRDQQSKITVSYKDYLIAFEFAGLDFASPDNNRYAYKLEGFDADWIEARDVRKATYTNLPAGNYVFKVKASNNDGVWNENGAGIVLTVLPAPWFSWWAYSIYLIIFLGAAFWLYRSYLSKIRQEETYRLELENEVQKRTVELSSANEQLLNASVTDQLTGLHNRRYLANVIKEKCNDVVQEFREHMAIDGNDPHEGPRLFFLMFDLDGFKPINDTYGHDAGDKVIIQVGELLQSVCREDDIVIRWGGDEFIVVGKVYKKSEVSGLAERIRDTIAKYGFNIGLSQRMHLSSSIGYAMYPFAHFSPDSLSWEQVHLLADKALYRSKDSGRNTWCGMVQPYSAPPVGVLNTLTHNVDKAVEQKHIVLETPESIKRERERDKKNESDKENAKESNEESNEDSIQARSDLSDRK